MKDENSIISVFSFKSGSEHCRVCYQIPTERNDARCAYKSELFCEWDAVAGWHTAVEWELQSSSSSMNWILTGWVLKRHPWRLSSNWIELHLILLPSSFGSLLLIRVLCRVSQASLSLFHISQLIWANWPNQRNHIAQISQHTPQHHPLTVGSRATTAPLAYIPTDHFTILLGVLH